MGAIPEPFERYTNRLSLETSPYLLQHQHNPVDWYPWGEEAFEKARRENKPLLISIGYSACHWCHVMEHESFENDQIARLMNETLVAVKVDREEHPDVDSLYMTACMAMTGQGGWPLNAFVTPDLKPFFVGTYFPPEDRWGRPGFRRILERVREAWQNESGQLINQADAFSEELQRFSYANRPGTIDPEVFERLAAESAEQFDTRHGGFGGAPKFPPDQRLAALLVAYDDLEAETALRMVTQTLDEMAYGGIYDQLGGGFARYSVDAKWLVPHFEKMLYNQALLVPVYLDAYLLTGKDLYRSIASETLDWVLRVLRAPEGTFYSALDADSEGEEGKFYVWTPGQMKEALGAEDGQLACEYFGVTTEGNFEHGTSVLHVAVPPEAFAEKHDMSPEQWRQRLCAIKAKLLAVRQRRVPPGKDDKCLTEWNALMISALTRGWQVLGELRYLDAARAATSFMLGRLRKESGELLRCYAKGEAKISGVLNDYAFFIAALIDLYESCFELHCLKVARELADMMIDRFADTQHGGFFLTPAGEHVLIARPKELHDNSLPAGSSVATRDLLRLAVFFDDERYRQIAEQALQATGTHVNAAPSAYSSLLLAWRFTHGRVPEIVISRQRNETVSKEFLEAAWRTYMPARVLAATCSGRAEALALTRGRGDEGKPTAYLCSDYACQAPVYSPEEFAALLKQRG